MTDEILTNLIETWRDQAEEWKRDGLDKGDDYASGCAYGMREAASQLEGLLEAQAITRKMCKP